MIFGATNLCRIGKNMKLTAQAGGQRQCGGGSINGTEAEAAASVEAAEAALDIQKANFKIK